jgi:predicted phosphodiesterase
LRVALVSDAHGNAVGLRSALDDLAGRDVDLVVSLGDVAQGGPQPLECLDLLRKAGALTVMGNSDAFLLDAGAGRPREPTTERHLVQRDWVLSRLSPEDVDYLRGFEPTVQVALDELELLCFHGTPDDYDGIVLPTDPPDGFDGTGADVLAGGHVHIQQVRRVGEAVYVNPGSVGCGYGSVEPEGFHLDAWASYAIVEARSVELHRVPFDLDELARLTRASGIPMPDHTLSLYRR